MMLSDSLSDSINDSKNKYQISTINRHAKQIITFRIFAHLPHTDTGCFKMSQLRSKILVCHRERKAKTWEEKLKQYIFTVKTLCN